ncbi:nitroreductase/quinone reductase family protein [Mycobacteroides franklinii]|uniref:nitroreductase/quinone reductase family protein n=1 Tax=Mycobacteroides franklinii TaxID=948102 RepID=UPI0013E8A856|nr:hypothetical protein [Mycobacteroides franklinii]
MTTDDSIIALNERIIAEFRDNDGKVGPPFENSRVALFHLVGARTGAQRLTPLAYFDVGGHLLIGAGSGGSPRNPDWVHNLRRMGKVTVDLATDTGIRTTAVAPSELTGAERDHAWEQIEAIEPSVRAYAQATAGIRVIPVFRLDEVTA